MKQASRRPRFDLWVVSDINVLPRPAADWRRSVDKSKGKLPPGPSWWFGSGEGLASSDSYLFGSKLAQAASPIIQDRTYAIQTTRSRSENAVIVENGYQELRMLLALLPPAEWWKSGRSILSKWTCRDLKHLKRRSSVKSFLPCILRSCLKKGKD